MAAVTGRRVGRRKAHVRAFNGQGALSILRQGRFGKAREVFGLTSGDFSKIDLIEAVLKYTGPADVVICTWTAYDADMRQAKSFAERGDITGMRWLVDRSFRTRKPEMFEALLDIWGRDVIIEVSCHAKFVLISNNEWHVVIQTSMNLNRNKRIESFTVTEDPRLHEIYSGMVDDVFGASASKPVKKSCSDAIPGNLIDGELSLGWE